MYRKLGLIGLAILIFAVACSSSEPAGPVAIVNGSEISRSAFETELEYELEFYEMLGIELNDEDIAEIREGVLERLINIELLLGAAAAAGITTESVDVDAELDLIRDMFDTEDEFLGALESEGYTLDTYKQIMQEHLMVQALLDKELDFGNIELTPEELQELEEFYDDEFADLEDAPEREEVLEYYSSLWIEEKADMIVWEYIEELRAESEIEYLD
ncbi:MAG: hypothetical protein FH749_13300 [Firmicutes bacterium]|nr:hypothetical protein [Bacillota bacterium]